MAVHMLSLAGPHSYQISRLIAPGAREAGYDGVIYRRESEPHVSHTRACRRFDSV